MQAGVPTHKLPTPVMSQVRPAGAAAHDVVNPAIPSFTSSVSTPSPMSWHCKSRLFAGAWARTSAGAPFMPARRSRSPSRTTRRAPKCEDREGRRGCCMLRALRGVAARVPGMLTRSSMHLHCVKGCVNNRINKHPDCIAPLLPPITAPKSWSVLSAPVTLEKIDRLLQVIDTARGEGLLKHPFAPPHGHGLCHCHGLR